MNKSLYSKLIVIILVLILALSAVMGAFLMRGVHSFYINEFYDQMQVVFSSPELADDLRAAAAGEDAPVRMAEILKIHAGQLGIDSGRRNYFILDGSTGACLTGSDAERSTSLVITPNILTAISGSEGYRVDAADDYMDVALPIRGSTGASYIIYILDSKDTVADLSGELLGIILVSLAVAAVISVLLGVLLARALVTPITDLTRAAERVASGDFSDKPESQAQDEIGVLSRTFNDMAGQLEANLDELRRSEQMRREFVANVSHELRTPITSIRSYAETLYDDPELPPDMAHDFLRVIVNESDRMTKIVQDLLTLSKFDAGRTSFDIETFRFEQSVRDVYSATLIEAQHHKHEFSLEFCGPIPRIQGDRARIEQVLINMVSNAIKYTPDGGRIRMTAGAEGSEVWCTVRDNGIGIPAADLEHVFDRFYRVDKARSRESGGTGLGLSIAREIVVRHGGDITIQSRQGRGTTITLRLPVGGPEHA